MVQTKPCTTYKTHTDRDRQTDSLSLCPPPLSLRIQKLEGDEGSIFKGQESREGRAEWQTYSGCLQFRCSEHSECQPIMEQALCSRLRKQLSAHKYMYI